MNKPRKPRAAGTQVSISMVQEINQLHSEICQAARMTLEKAVRIGELLTQQKVALKHGEWLPWLETNIQFTDRTARNYMRVYKKRDQIKSETISDLTDAYQFLVEPKFDDSIKTIDLDLVDPGEDLIESLVAQVEVLKTANLQRYEALNKFIELDDSTVESIWQSLLTEASNKSRRFMDLYDPVSRCCGRYDPNKFNALSIHLKLLNTARFIYVLNELDDVRESVRRSLPEVELVRPKVVKFIKLIPFWAALFEVRDKRLYREQYSSFETYLRESWYGDLAPEVAQTMEETENTPLSQEDR